MASGKSLASTVQASPALAGQSPDSANEPVKGLGVNARLIAGSVWLLAARIADYLLNMFAVVFAANLISPVSMGIYATAYSWSHLCGNLIVLSIEQGLIQKPDVTAQDYDQAFTLRILHGLLITAVTVVVCTPAIINELVDPFVLLAVCLAPLVRCFSNPYFQNFERQIDLSAFSIVAPLARLAYHAGVISVGLIYDSPFAMALGLILEMLVWTISSYAMTSCRPRLTNKLGGGLLYFSAWAGALKSSVRLQYHVGVIVVSSFLGANAAGILAVGNQMTKALIGWLKPIYSRVVFATLSRSSCDLAGKQGREIYALSIYALLAIPALVISSVYVENLYDLLFDKRWNGAELITRAMLISMFFRNLQLVLETMTLSRGYTKETFYWLAGPNLLVIPVYFLVVPRFGIEGFVIAEVATTGVIFLVCITMFIRMLKMPAKLIWALFAKYIMAAGMSIAAVETTIALLELAFSLPLLPMILLVYLLTYTAAIALLNFAFFRQSACYDRLLLQHLRQIGGLLLARNKYG